MTTPQFYVKRPEQWGNIEEFITLMREFPEMGFFQPNSFLAPWHWQGVARGQTFNFWPHLCKWSQNGERGRNGWGDAKKAIKLALSTEPDLDHPLLEDN